MDKPDELRVYLLCGKTGSGKPTYAKKLEQQGAVRFSIDEWMIRFYGHHMSRELFDQRVRICEDMFFDLAEALVSRGVDVVLDHGFWLREASLLDRKLSGSSGKSVSFPSRGDEVRIAQRFIAG